MYENSIGEEFQTKQISWGKWYRYRNNACKYVRMSERAVKRKTRKEKDKSTLKSTLQIERRKTEKKERDSFLLFCRSLSLYTLDRYLPVIQISYLLPLSDQSPQFFTADAFAYTHGFYIVVDPRRSLCVTDQIT